jgi:hypothetical protein
VSGQEMELILCSDDRNAHVGLAETYATITRPHAAR